MGLKGENKMGCFDYVIVKCPKCGTEEYFQSKGGLCACLEYKLATCPDDVLEDVNRHSPYECVKCGTHFLVDTDTRTVIVSLLSKESITPA